MAWRPARTLEVLLSQVNAKWPDRDKSWDGTIGNEEHAARTSDHNPDVDGVVKAMDITHDPAHGFDSYMFADMLRLNRDPRIKYIISNRRIAGDEAYAARNKTQPWTWGHYGGQNPHDHHVHVSVNRDQARFDNISPWKIDDLAPSPVGTIHPKQIGRSLVKIGSSGPDVAYLQRMLGIAATGVFDEATENAVIEFQKRYGLAPDGRVGAYTWRQLEA